MTCALAGRLRAARTLGEIIDGAGGEPVVAEYLATSPNAEPLLVNAVEAVTRSSCEAKRRLLVRAAVNAH
jgi:hypothetical protein